MAHVVRMENLATRMVDENHTSTPIQEVGMQSERIQMRMTVSSNYSVFTVALYGNCSFRDYY